MAAAVEQRAPIVFDVPLLVESAAGAPASTASLVVDCSRGRRRSNAWCSAPAGRASRCARVIAQQAPRAARRAIADAVIHNDGLARSSELRIAAHALWALWVRPGLTAQTAVKQCGLAPVRSPAGAGRALILYEYPFNESIRTMLRLEHLFDRLGQLIVRDAPVDHHFALATLFEIMDVARAPT